MRGQGRAYLVDDDGRIAVLKANRRTLCQHQRREFAIARRLVLGILVAREYVLAHEARAASLIDRRDVEGLRIHQRHEYFEVTPDALERGSILIEHEQATVGVGERVHEG